jgi:NADH-quinone oxidoreductase subunit C
MDQQAIHKKLSTQFGKDIISLEEIVGDHFIEVSSGKLVEIGEYLLADEDLLFDSLVCVSGAHYPATSEEENTRFEVVYHFFSYAHKHKLVLKVILSGEDLTVPSLEKTWKGAQWLERETYDMYGIKFDGNSDLRRILCPDDWVGWPLRKDYKQPEMYRHMKVPL